MIYTMDDFEDTLNDEKTMILGKWYGNGTLLRKIDPVQFHVEYHQYMSSMEEAMDEEREAADLEDAIALLNHYVLNGMEYPDAFFKTTTRYPTIKQEDLQQAYDSQ
jgi:hypothetical protein